jgi:hypothetical protein
MFVFACMYFVLSALTCEQCYDLEQCDAKLKTAQDTGKDYEEGDYISQYLKRMWYEESK